VIGGKRDDAELAHPVLKRRTLYAEDHRGTVGASDGRE
jgi:hypothetical protein